MVKQPSPLFDRLLARVKRATSRYGEKSNLARYMGIPPQRVNDWFAGYTLPNGETTLQLLEWVTAAEAKQKTHAGSASTLPALKTRKRKYTSNEKPNSGPQTG